MTALRRWNLLLTIQLLMPAVVIACFVYDWQREQTVSTSQLVAVISVLVGTGIAITVVLRRRKAEDLSDSESFEQQREELQQERAAFDQLKTDIDSDLKRRATQIDARSADLAHRLIAFQEWLEYPQSETDEPLDGADTPSSSAVGSRGRTDLKTAELIEQDHRVIELLDAEARACYQRIRDGEYRLESGEVNVDRIRTDIVDLTTRVARVYQPNAKNPLLETSVEQLLRAGSRTCLHLLIVLERLPLNLHEASFSTIHSYVQRAVKAYDMYSAAEPYLGYVSKALYAGRMASSTNPVTIGLTWALSEFGRRGIKAAGKKFVDQQAVAILGDLVRVIGFEVAGIFGGDFRHRDANWIYGAELTDLMSRFPVSRENLTHALREIGSLTLRNEYDRIFLYRCVSMHRAAPSLVDAHQTLPPDQRQEVGRRLEKFFTSFIYGRTRKRVSEWLEGAESRLGIKLAISVPQEARGAASESSGVQEAVAAFDALAAFMMAVKGQPLSSLQTVAPHLETASMFGLDLVPQRLQHLSEMPPQYFEPPDLDPDSSAAGHFLNDLVRLTVRSRPFDLQPDDLVLETYAFYAQDVKDAQKRLDQEYSDFLRSLQPSDAPVAKLAPVLARRILQTLEALPTEASLPALKFVYPEVKLTATPGTDIPSGTIWLAGLPDLLLLGTSTETAWLATAKCSTGSLSRVDGMMIDDCRLTGFNWTTTDGTPLALEVTIPGAAMTRYESRFAALINAMRPGLPS